jgi:hypothetical protein
MKVAIDAQALGAQRGGDETYMRNLIHALATVDPDTDYTLFLAQPLSPRIQFPGLKRIRRVVLRHHRLIRRIPVAMPLALMRHRIEVLHAQYAGPPICPVPVVLSLHDIAYERYPQFFPHNLSRHLRAIVPPAIGRAAVVLTLSEFSRRDIVQCYQMPPEKVIVAPCAADPIVRPMHAGHRTHW